jgi:hypothetical protein
MPETAGKIKAMRAKVNKGDLFLEVISMARIE